MLEEGS